MRKKHLEFAANYVANEFIGQQQHIFVPKLPAYKAFVALFNQYGKRFDIAKFNHRIEILLTK